mmetsp:Transcript_19286/g.43295  ORF Transcript_19286/g.43295 Transcript_19286/m.43295 type:complete len:1057 (-) Transcript_19286:81-3251(-)
MGADGEADAGGDENQGTFGKVRDSCVDPFVDCFVYRPCICCWSCGCAIFLLSVIAIAAEFMTIGQQDLAWEIWEGQNTQDWQAFDYARDQVSESDRNYYGGRRLAHKTTSNIYQTEGTGRRLQSEGDDNGLETLYLYYKAPSGDVFTKDGLETICNLEGELYRKREADLNEALQREDGPAGAWQTPLRLFYGSVAPGMIDIPSNRYLSPNWADDGANCGTLTDAYVEATVQAMYLDIQALNSESEYAKFVHPEFAQSRHSPYTSTKIEFEEDLAGKITEDAQDLLGLEYGFLRSAYQGDDDRMVEYEILRVRLMYTDLDDFEKMIGPDFGLAFFSFIFVFLVMYAYTGSLFIGAFGMFQILFSLPLSSLLYRGLFQVDYFEFLHILVVYLVLGIGADDIFVLVDTFRHIDNDLRGEQGGWSEDKFRRVMKAAYIRSASAILNTSFTTAVAFLASSGSKAMPMRTCGWYAAICILMNYILTITFTPAIVSIWHTRFHKKCCCSVDCSYREELPPEEQSTDAEPQVKESIVEKVLGKTYIPFMSYGFDVGCISIRPGSCGVILVMLVVAIQGIAFAAQLSPPRKAEVWFPDNHMAVEFSDFSSDVTFSPDHESLTVMGVFWGISELDTSTLEVYKPDDFTGGTVYDGAFDLTSHAAQQRVLDTCQALRELRCTEEACKNHGYNVRTLMMQADGKTHACFMEDFKAYIEWRSVRVPGAPTWPLNSNAFISELRMFRNGERGDREESGCCHYDNTLEENYREDIGFIDDQLKYVQIRIRSTVQWDTPFGTGTDVRDLLDDWMDNTVRADAPQGMGSAKYHGQGLFASYDLGEELLNGLFQGCAIAAPIAFCVLLAATWNLIVSLYAVSCVGAIVLCVLGFCRSAMDWDLGIGEAIAGVIVLGYSVDYVVHLAHIYCEGGSHHGLHDRGSRAAFAIRNMGSTVFAGAVTTAGSASVMFFCFFYFFTKMAILITITIMYAFLFSLGMLMALLWTVGPQGNFGNLGMCCPCCAQDDSPAKVVPSDPESKEPSKYQPETKQADNNVQADNKNAPIKAFDDNTTA